MKKHASIIGIIFLALIISVSCNQQSTEADLQEDLAGIREGHEEVINRIDEAMNNIENVSEFRSGIQNALDELDNQIDDYHAEMDKANLRIDKETRDAIIEMKQKKTAIEFKLDMLEDMNENDVSSIGMTDGAERTGDASGPDREYEGSDWTDTDEDPLTDQIDDRTGPQRPGQMRSPERTGEWAGGPENSANPARNESEIQDAARETSPDVSADDLEQTEVYRTPYPSDSERSGTERSGAERSGIMQDTTQKRGIAGTERSVNERTGTERTGTERTSTERTSTERSGTERSGILQDTTQTRGIAGTERSVNERTVTERSGAERSGILQDTAQMPGTSDTERSGAERSDFMQDTAQTSVASGAERTRDMENAEEDDMSSYYLEILNEIKNDIRELRSEIEEFKQKELKE